MSQLSKRKKTRGEAFEHSLTPEQLSQLYAWCSHTFKVAQANALQEWGLKLSVKQLHRWYHKDDDLRILSFIATGAHMNRQIEEAYQHHPEPQVETLVKVCKTLVMQLSVQGATDPDKLDAANSLFRSVIEFLKLQEKQEARKLDERKIEMMEAKFKEARDQVKKLREPGSDISQTERDAILDKVDEVLGLK